MSPASQKNGLTARADWSRARKMPETKAAWQRSFVLLCLSLLFCCVTATAQTPPGTATAPGTQPANPCDKKNKSLKDTASCLKHIYDKVTKKDGFHLVHGGVAPGSGTSLGVGYSVRKPYENWRVELNTSARASFKKYWEIDSNLRLTKSENRFSGNTANGPIGDLKINIYGLVKDMPRLDFFGIGPETREQDRAVFHYREGVVGADISKPLTPWLDVGGAVEGIFPNIVTISNPTVRSVERVYTEATAPGITSQPGFFHAAAFVGLHLPGQPESRKLEYKFFYHAYQDVSDHRYSFRRFDADLKHKLPFADKNELRFRARFSFSDTSGANRVPFYLMETLGGSNIRSDDTLRGFRDYRFRDRDLVLLQAEYLRDLYQAIKFIAFYDTGKVFPSLGRFDRGRMRHTYGLGIVVVPRRGDNVLFRFYVALGSGEGSHTFFGVGDALGGRADRLVR